MKSLIKDIIFSIICFAIIISASIQLYNQFATKLAYGGEKVGTISYKKKKAERKFSEHVIWEKLEENYPIYNYDTIRTFNGSEAVLNLNNGTKISLDENTLILISIKKGKVGIDFTMGSFSAKRPDKNSKDFLSIKNKDTTINLKHGDLTLSKTEDSVRVDIARGNGNIEKNNNIIPLSKNQSALIDNNNVDVTNPDISLTSPGNNEYYFTKSARMKIEFNWQMENINKAILQISKSNSFLKKDLIVSKLLTTSNFSMKFNPDTYYWRLKSIKEKNNYIITRKFKITRDKESKILFPQKNKIIDYYKTKPEIKFRWTKSPMANSYQLEISKNINFNKIISSYSSNMHSIYVNNLEKGKYFCRIKSIYKSGEKDNFITGPISSFIIINKINKIKPQLLSPYNKYRRSILAYNKNNEIFTWTENNEISYYEFQLSDSLNFDYIVNSTKTAHNYYRINIPLPQGKYYWRVKGYYSIEEKPEISKTNTYILSEAEKIIATKPEDNRIINPADTEGKIKFSWQDPNNGKSFKFYIASNRKFTINKKEYSTVKNFIFIPDLANEKIFWKVSLLDKNKNILSTSKIMTLIISEKLKDPEGLSPKDNVELPTSYAKNIYFSWKPVQDATSYEFKFYKYRRAWKRLIVSKKTETNNFIFHKTKQLTSGNYFWEVRAIKEEGNKITRQSGLKKFHFRIKSGRKVKSEEIEITSPDMIYVE